MDGRTCKVVIHIVFESHTEQLKVRIDVFLEMISRAKRAGQRTQPAF